MGFLQSYGLFLIKNPGKILICGVLVVLLLFTLTLVLRPLPSFRDPLIGFEARGTPISARINSWKLLLDETSASAHNLSLVANSPRYEGPYQSVHPLHHLNNELNLSGDKISMEPPTIEMSTQHAGGNSSFTDLMLDEDEDEYYKSINSTQETIHSLMHYSLDSSKAFCGKLYEAYAQIVVAPSTRYSRSGLFNLNSMLAICQLDGRLRLEHSLEDSGTFHKECEKFQTSEEQTHPVTTTCCNSWSLPNYIACLSNKTSCMEIEARDIKNTEQLLNLCAPYYFKAPYEECFINWPRDKDDTTNAFNIRDYSTHRLDWSQTHCGSIPDKCLRCSGWTYTVMNYLTNENFVQNRALINQTSIIGRHHSSRQRATTSNRDSIVGRLTYTNIFLPIAKSSSLLRYYQTLSNYNLKTPFAQVKAMDLGLKNSLFEHLISDDTRLFVIALITILLVISIYNWSFIISFVILMIICLSLCLSYTIYELVLDIPIFPFMNLLAVVISFGICSDNAMLFCKYWTLSNYDDNSQVEQNSPSQSKITSREQVNLDRMLKKAVISTSVATFATACSFIISAISKVIAVRCFCIFATLSVITNYLLIVILLPPTLILDSRFSIFINKCLAGKGSKTLFVVESVLHIRERFIKIGSIVNKRLIFNVVTEYKLYLIITFVTLLACSSILVFHKPTLQPSDDEDIQLFSSKHTFEQYDKNLKKQFAFERIKLGEPIASANSVNQIFEPPETLPIRIVFGILPSDDGNHFDPLDRGSIKFDPKFDITEQNAQIWLLEFCHKLKQRRFVHPSSTLDLTSCFIDTFKSWMDTRLCKDRIQTDLDRSPCCQAYEFPYSRSTFNKCVGEAVSMMRKTPRFNPNSSAGVRFFKNSTKIAAIILEYQSNRLFSESYTKMKRFLTDIDDWVTWQMNNTAPPSLKSGWFISSNLELLALQTELEQSTMSSILLEVLFAMLALLIGTRDLVLTITGSLTIGTIIIVTVATLIVLKWTLGVAESILISLTIGLSIDFALHYSVAYSESRRVGTSYAIINRILNEVGSPIALATITTTLAGFVIVWSDILAYQELGVFLMLIASISWITSTFLLVPMLATVGSIVERSDAYARILLNVH